MGAQGIHKVTVKPKPVKVVGNLDECFQKLNVESEEARDGSSQGQDGSALKSIIFGWTIQDMMNEKLLKSKVNSIPMKFSSSKDYFNHFSWPLVEEIRAQLQQSMERLGETPCFSLISKKEIMHRSQRVPRKLAVCIDTKPMIDARQGKKHSDFMLKRDDVILLSSVPPRDVKDIQRPGVLHFIASIEEVRPAGDSPILQATVHVHSKSYKYEDLMERNRSWFVIYLTSLTPHLRIWSALHPHGMNKTVSPIIEETLYSEALGQKVVSLGNKYALTTEKIKGTLVEYCASFHLNESQTAAVVSIVSGLYERKAPYVRMIQGPPGTGKTSVLVSLLSVISSLNKRCLVCAPTNGAISLVAQRYMGLLNQNLEEIQLTPTRTVKQKKAAIFSPSSIHLSDLVLVGNEDKLLLEGALGEIFLPYRAQRLSKTLNPHTGWRAAAVSLLEFLESAKSQFKKMSQKKRNNNVNPISTDKAENHISFLVYVRDRLPRLAKAVSDHSNTLINDLPNCLMEKSRLNTISGLAHRVVDLLMEPGSRESDLFRWFSDTLQEVEPSSLNCMPDVHGDQGNFPETRKILAGILRMDIKKFAEGPLKSPPSEKSIEKLCFKHSRVVFCTVSTAGRDSVKKAAPFDCAIIDEAAQLVEAETAIVTRIPGLTHAILIGDHQQLPATVISKVAAKSGYSRSLFERLQKLNHPSHLLNTQYRMHPSISSFPNAQFYKGRINDGENVKKQVQKVYQEKLYGTYAFIDVRDGIEKKNGQSLHNPVEAAVLIHIIKKLHKAACSKNKISELSVGVITPYAGQVQAISALWKTQQQQNGVNLEIKSVDGFQGQEMDVILFSAVRSNQRGNIGFLKDYRRLNVALTRARFCLWIVGNAKTLTTRDKVWRVLVGDAKNKGSYIDSGKDAEIMKVIRKGHPEAGKLDLANKNQPSGSKERAAKDKPAAQVSKRASKRIRVKKVSVSRVARTLICEQKLHCSQMRAGSRESNGSNSGPETTITASAHKLEDEHVAGASSRCSQIEQPGQGMMSSATINNRSHPQVTKKKMKKKLKIVLRKDDRSHTPAAASSVTTEVETTQHPFLQFINSHKLPQPNVSLI